MTARTARTSSSPWNEESLAPGDTLIVSGSAKYSSADVWSSSTIIFTPDAITTGNYRLSSDPVTFYGVRILPATITVTPDAGQHKTFTATQTRF